MLSPSNREVLVGWHPVDSCAKWASSAKTNRCGAAQRLWATPARRFELLPLPLSGPPRNLLEDSLLFPGRQPCEAIAIDRPDEVIEVEVISQSVMRVHLHEVTCRPTGHATTMHRSGFAPSTRRVANRALRHCRESG